MKRSLTGIFLALLLISAAAASVAVERMNKETLKAKFGSRDLTVIDVRQPHDLSDSKLKIRGAVRQDPEADVASWAAGLPRDRTYVLYCA